MKKRIRNTDLEEILKSASLLGNYPMPGNLALAVISARHDLKEASNAYNEACRRISETHCERDAEGHFLSEYQKDAHGNNLTDLPKRVKFKTVAAEASAIEELRKLGEQEAEVEVQEIHAAMLENLQNITPVQMETLLWLVEATK